MQITGISFSDFMTKVIEPLNATKFADNKIQLSNVREHSKNRFSVKIDMSDSRAPGSRRSASGRHGKYASWWTFYDIMAGVFDLNESARISAGTTIYKGYSSFVAQTVYGPQDNIGSMMSPFYHDDASIDYDFDTNEFQWKAYRRGEGWSSNA